MFYNFCKLFHKVVEGWYKIKPFFSNNSDEQSLLSYFESTFISKRTCLRLGTEIPEQIPPLFHPQVWSVAAQVEVELSRTVVTELWYNRLKTYGSDTFKSYFYVLVVLL